MGLPNAEAYPQIIFFIILASVIITTIGLGKASRKFLHLNQLGGFVKPPEEPDSRMKLQTVVLLQKNHQMNGVIFSTRALYAKFPLLEVWKIFLMKNYLGKIFKD